MKISNIHDYFTINTRGMGGVNFEVGGQILLFSRWPTMLNFGRMNMLQICFWFLWTCKNTWKHFQNDLRTKNWFFLQPKISHGVKWGSSRNFCIFSSSQRSFKRLRKWLVDEFKKLRNALQTVRWTPKNILHIFKSVVRRLEVNIEPF